MNKEPVSLHSMKAFLDAVYKRYHHPKFLSSDPLCLVHEYDKREDKEVAALICAVFAYGQVRHIKAFLRKYLASLGDSPYRYLINITNNTIRKELYYRFQTPEDILLLTATLGDVLRKYKSLEMAFMSGHSDKSTMKEAISNFTALLCKSGSEVGEENKLTKTKYFDFLFPSPKDGSCCKRINMFLRWMIRGDEIDLGLWHNISPGRLFIPLDVHVARITKNIGLTRRKNPNWSMVEEISENLRSVCHEDPIKYDFSLCRIGIMKICPNNPSRKNCEICELAGTCLVQ